RQLPLFLRVRIAVAPVQRRLVPEKIAVKITVTMAVAVDPLVAGLVFPDVVGPDIPVGIAIGLLFARGDEPWIVNRGVGDDVIEQDLEAAFVRLGKQSAGVVVAAVTRRDLVVIADVVTGVVERRIEKRVDPDGVHAEAFDVIQLLDEARQVADAVAVGIVKRLRINLINDGVIYPGGTIGNDVLAGD